nr:uncharacterized protein LOC127316608 [Lolium perenne]
MVHPIPIPIPLPSQRRSDFSASPHGDYGAPHGRATLGNIRACGRPPFSCSISWPSVSRLACEGRVGGRDPLMVEVADGDDQCGEAQRRPQLAVGARAERALRGTDGGREEQRIQGWRRPEPREHDQSSDKGHDLSSDLARGEEPLRLLPVHQAALILLLLWLPVG